MINKKQNFFDQLDGGWDDIIADTYKEHTYYIPPTRQLGQYKAIDGQEIDVKQIPNKQMLIDEDVDIIPPKCFLYADTIMGPIEFPDNISLIDTQAFRFCTGINNYVKLPAGITRVTTLSFSRSTITELILGTNVKTIEESAFSNCKKLTKIVWNDKLESIGVLAFDNCIGLTGDLILPDFVSYIAKYAFIYCTGLNGSLILPKNLEKIGEQAFKYTNFKYVRTNSNLNVIGHECFGNCKNLETVEFEEGIESIFSYAFNGCKKLKGSIKIPKSVNFIGEYAFKGCTSLEKIYVPSHLELPVLTDNDNIEIIQY